MTKPTIQSLRAGFQALTLAPSPRLREHRQRLANRDLTVEAWNDVARSIRESTKIVAASIKKS